MLSVSQPYTTPSLRPVHDGPYASHSYLHPPSSLSLSSLPLPLPPNSPPVPPLSSLPLSSLECSLLRDGLNILMGVEGRFVRVCSWDDASNSPLFGYTQNCEGKGVEEGEVEREMDNVLPQVELVKRVSVLGSHYYSVCAFVARMREREREGGRGRGREGREGLCSQLCDAWPSRRNRWHSPRIPHPPLTARGRLPLPLPLPPSTLVSHSAVHSFIVIAA